MTRLLATLALLLSACDHDPGPMKLPSHEDVPLSPLPPASTPEPVSAPPAAATPPSAVKRAPCVNDQSCNDDESVSTLWGKCTPLGTCECSAGFELNPRGRCQKPIQ
jgi:hypothetical protein